MTFIIQLIKTSTTKPPRCGGGFAQQGGL